LKKLLIALLLFPCLAIAQEYVDLFKIGYGETFNNNFEGTTSSTRIKTFEADLIFPVVLNKKNALITGAAFSRNNLQLFPESEFTSLYSTTFKLGLASTYNDKWSSTTVLLPKIASDYNTISGDDFYFGGFAVLKIQKHLPDEQDKKNLIYRFGFYGSSEAYGIFSTPIIGWYYLSPNGKFEMDMSLPIVADVNYTCGSFTYGIDYFGIGRSFNITKENANVYVDLSSLEFASYLQYNALHKSVLLRAKFGYSSNDFEVYTKGDEIDFGLSAFSFGDDRTQLNPSINGGLYLKFEAIYRFDITSEKDNSKK
jgi:hypothetical protein